MTSDEQYVISQAIDTLREIVNREPITIYNLEEILREFEEAIEKEVEKRNADKFYWR